MSDVSDIGAEAVEDDVVVSSSVMVVYEVRGRCMKEAKSIPHVIVRKCWRHETR